MKRIVIAAIAALAFGILAVPGPVAAAAPKSGIATAQPVQLDLSARRYHRRYYRYYRRHYWYRPYYYYPYPYYYYGPPYYRYRYYPYYYRRPGIYFGFGW